MATIKEILTKYGFRFNKALGQNFITDINLLNAIAEDGLSGAEGATVVEIGTGAGTLTKSLAERAKNVITFEVDRNLAQVQNEYLSENKNVKVVFADVLKMRDDEFFSAVFGDDKNAWNSPIFVVANLPYYITTPLIMRFLESSINVASLTLMMQIEVALRLTARAGTAEYGAITASVEYHGDVRILRKIDRKIFIPSPEVDSALVRIDIKNNKFDVPETAYKKVVKAAFMWRRKTLANNICTGLGVPKSEVEKILCEMGFPPNVRGEMLCAQEFAALAAKMRMNPGDSSASW